MDSFAAATGTVVFSVQGNTWNFGQHMQLPYFWCTWRCRGFQEWLPKGFLKRVQEFLIIMQTPEHGPGAISLFVEIGVVAVLTH